MTDYRLMPEEATPEMEQAAEKYWNDRKFKALSDDPRTWKGLYAAMRAAAPAVQGEPVAITDADILAIAGRVESCPVSPWWLKDDVAIGDVRAAVLRFARALLVATPQLAEREIPGSYPVSGQIFFRVPSNEWVLELTGSVNGTTFTARHTQPADTRPEDVAGLPALYESTPDITQLVEAASAALDEIEAIMREAYNSAEPVCCGRGGAGGCCGSPEPEWSEIDQNTIGRLWPHQRALTSALAAYRKGGE